MPRLPRVLEPRTNHIQTTLMKAQFTYENEEWSSPSHILLTDKQSHELRNIPDQKAITTSTYISHQATCEYLHFIPRNGPLAAHLKVGDFEIRIKPPNNCKSLQWVQGKDCVDSPRFRYSLHQKSWDSMHWKLPSHASTWFLQAEIEEPEEIRPLKTVIQELQDQLKDAQIQLSLIKCSKTG